MSLLSWKGRIEIKNNYFQWNTINLRKKKQVENYEFYFVYGKILDHIAGNSLRGKGEFDCLLARIMINWFSIFWSIKSVLLWHFDAGLLTFHVHLIAWNSKRYFNRKLPKNIISIEMLANIKLSNRTLNFSSYFIIN